MRYIVILYKYLNAYRIDVLKSNSIRFTPPNEFNDPFEFKFKINEITNFEDTLNHALNQLNDTVLTETEKYGLQDKKDEIFDATIAHLHEFEDSFNDLFGDFFGSKAAATFYSELVDLSGVLSLSEDEKNILMWSHYADSHKGYCIGFNSQHDFFNAKRSEHDEFNHLREVYYTTDFPDKHINSLESIDVFLTKAIDWRYEKEWRIIKLLSDADKTLDLNNTKVHLFNIPSDAVCEIIIGCNANDDFTKEICNLVNQRTDLSHVKLKKAEISKNQYKIILRDL